MRELVTPAACNRSGARPILLRRIDMTEPIVRFHGKYAIGSRGCWLWTGATNRDGYGSFWNGKRLAGRNGKRGGPQMVLAHRWAYDHFPGSIPSGMNVLHRCDTPACVNPMHLFLGTQLDNVRDCAAKGRRNQIRHNVRPTYRKLSAEIHDAIRSRYADGSASRRELAAEYGVATQTIDYVIRRGQAA